MTTTQDGSGGRGEQSDLPPTLAAPARRALAQAGITRLAQLAMMREADLLKLHGLGPKTIGPLREALAAHGLTFAGGTRLAKE